MLLPLLLRAAADAHVMLRTSAAGVTAYNSPRSTLSR